MMSSPVPDNNTRQHKHHHLPRESHPRQHHHHHHHPNQAQKHSANVAGVNQTCNKGNSSDDCEEDALLDNLPRDDVPSILSLSISRSQSTYQNAALSGARPSLPSAAVNIGQKTENPGRDDPSPPKKTFFASQGKPGALGVLAPAKLFRPRASSLGNADHASKEHGDHDKWVSKLPTFSLPSLQLPQLPSFGSNSKEGMDKEKGATRSKRAGSLLIDSLAKAAAGVSNHFTTNGPVQASNSTCNAQVPKKPQSSLHIANAFPNTDPGFPVNPNTDEIPNSKFDPASAHTNSLRRSNSDSSSIRRALSRTSSIGSDTRFLDVREQKNARYKAIKDSILPDIKDSFTFNTPTLVKKATSGNLAAAAAAPAHPLDKLSGDVVIMGGYRGSILKKVKTSPTGEKRVGRTLWIPVKVGFNLQSVDLEVPLDPEAELLMEEKVIATDMLSHLAGVDISRRLIKKLRSNPNVRLHVFAYDWRLSPHLNSEKLVLFMANLPCNRMASKSEQTSIRDLWHEDGPFVIAHSLGGLITRHAINRRPDLFKCGGVLYAGVPQRCVNVLGPLRNGDSVAFNKDVLNAQANFSFRSTFVFLPEDGQVFVDRKTGHLIDFDLYDPAAWQQYNLSPCVSLTNKPAPIGLLGTASGAMATVIREGKDVREKLSRWTPSSPALLSDGAARKQPAKDDGTVPPQGSFVTDTPDAFVSEPLGNEAQEIAATGAGAAAPSMTVPVTANPQSSCTLPLSVTIPYLERTLRETKKFRSELAFQPSLAEQYPPCAVLYSKTTPTVKAARVDGLEGIKTSNYSDLIFGAGDGVVLSREAMLPEGYICEKRVHCDRGHISLLGDLDAVGQCIEALLEARERNKRRLLRTLGRSTPSSA
ncbi:hypothetical protein TWF718_002710 [Orbilia javanica]|uniref:Uncharacterized protein n=1 Tax=Orbilia javanica TaxID=47235 RepID=A0AAN8RJZ5_9PEZI